MLRHSLITWDSRVRGTENSHHSLCRALSLTACHTPQRQSASRHHFIELARPARTLPAFWAAPALTFSRLLAPAPRPPVRRACLLLGRSRLGLFDGPIGSIVSPIAGIINKLIPDKAAAAAATAQLQQMAEQGALAEELAQLQAVTSAQSDVDKVEAASASTFVAGARPFVMWVCGVGLAVSCIIAPLFTWASALAGHPTPFPKLDDPLLQSTLAGMLGLGHVSRTIEKIKGVQGNH